MKPNYLKWSEQSMIHFFEFWIELNGTHLVENVNELKEVEQGEADVPGKHVWSAHNAPCPHREQHEPCVTQSARFLTFNVMTIVFI